MKSTIENVVKLLFILAFCTPVWSLEVQEKLQNGIAVTAQYLPGEEAMGTVLVLHGFTTTREFSTVQSIVQEFSSSGYTVLAPTLSMNINNRRASVPCDAIHTSTLEDDIKEIEFWVNWLTAMGHKNISLIGHSMGSLQLVVYAANHPHKDVKQVIATSLIHTHRYTDADTIKRETAQAKQAMRQTPPSINGYHFVFCDSYMAPPQVYLSYMHWDKQQVFDALSNVKVPVSIVMGGKDRRFGKEWITFLERSGNTVKVIDGASHFFDAAHEFELLDCISEELQAELES